MTTGLIKKLTSTASPKERRTTTKMVSNAPKTVATATTTTTTKTTFTSTTHINTPAPTSTNNKAHTSTTREASTSSALSCANPAHNVTLESNNLFPVQVAVAGSGSFAENTMPTIVQHKHGSRFTLRQEAWAFNQRRQFELSAWLGAVDPYKKRYEKGLVSASTPHTAVTFVLRTNTIYYDSDAVAAWVQTSAPGFGRIQRQRIQLVLSRDGEGGGSKTLECGFMAFAHGQNCINSLAQANWFSESENVTVSVRAEIQGTSFKSVATQTLTLARKRDLGGIQTVGVDVVLPSFPVVAGDKFTAFVYANTYAKNVPPKNYFALQVINFKIRYDKTFTLRSTRSALYSVQTATKSASHTRTPAWTSDWILTQKVADENEVTGDDILLATLEFEVCLLYTSPSPRDS